MSDRPDSTSTDPAREAPVRDEDTIESAAGADELPPDDVDNVAGGYSATRIDTQETPDSTT